jgi:hypothetical protein
MATGSNTFGLRLATLRIRNKRNNYHRGALPLATKRGLIGASNQRWRGSKMNQNQNPNQKPGQQQQGGQQGGGQQGGR